MPTTASARQLIKAAIAAAGGQTAVAASMGITNAAVGDWHRNARVPADRLADLCRMGGLAIEAQAILDAMSRERREPAAEGA